MPANLSPEYIEADRKYRQAGTDEERLAALGEMLSAIPKHKGTEKLQADLACPTPAPPRRPRHSVVSR